LKNGRLSFLLQSAVWRGVQEKVPRKRGNTGLKGDSEKFESRSLLTIREDDESGSKRNREPRGRRLGNWEGAFGQQYRRIAAQKGGATWGGGRLARRGLRKER